MRWPWQKKVEAPRPRTLPPASTPPRPQPAKIGGAIGTYKLEDWWLSEFTPAERDYIEQTFQPFSVGGPAESRPLTQGPIGTSSRGAMQFLYELAGWFKKPSDASIGDRMFKKAETLPPKNVLDTHFLYSNMIDFYSQAMPIGDEGVIALCRKQIEVAPRAAAAFRRENPGDDLPYHGGYSSIIQLLPDRTEALAVAKQAKRQKWSGDWDGEIEWIKEQLAGTDER